MTFGTDGNDLGVSPASTPASTLTRRELRERERAAEGVSAAESIVDQGDAMPALFGVPAAPSVAPPAAPTAHPQGGNVFVPPAPSDAPQPFIFPTSSTRTAPGTPIATNQSSARRAPRITRTAGSRLLSLGAFVFAGALAFGMSIPANAFGPGSSALLSAGAAPAQVLQSVDVASNVEAVSATRDKWSVLSWADVLKDRYGSRDFSYATGNGSIRWPFPVAVPISSGYGDRVAPCRGCSSHHMGVDFTPGNGSAIFAIADGVVIEHKDEYGGFGNHVIIEHHINGHVVTSLYAHMQHGTSKVKVGDTIEVGDFLGLVGMTGTATGPHLHLEITVDGEHVDPFAWLKANVN